MAAALALGRRGLGKVWPNPAVGCVILDAAGRVAGRGWTQPGGRPHAETEALARAGARARGGAAFVTLEPCSHHGKTPPCAEALIAAGVSRVVAAISDPDPRVGGRGFAMLQAAGIAVETGLMARQAAYDQAGFLSRVERGRPLVALKLAASLDGRIAAANGDSRWITGPEARRIGHLLRASHDAILVGFGTALADDPRLDCRIAGLEAASPVRLVLDSQLRLPLASDLVRRAHAQPTWALCVEGADTGRQAALEAAGVTVIPTPTGSNGRVDLKAALAELGRRGLTRVLAEGGGAVAAGLLRAGLADRIYSFQAPMALGGDGIAAIGPLGLERVADAPRFIRQTVQAADDDLVATFVRNGGS